MWKKKNILLPKILPKPTLHKDAKPKIVTEMACSNFFEILPKMPFSTFSIEDLPKLTLADNEYH